MKGDNYCSKNVPVGCDIIKVIQPKEWGLEGRSLLYSQVPEMGHRIPHWAMGEVSGLEGRENLGQRFSWGFQER